MRKAQKYSEEGKNRKHWDEGTGSGCIKSSVEAHWNWEMVSSGGIRSRLTGPGEKE